MHERFHRAGSLETSPIYENNTCTSESKSPDFHRSAASEGVPSGKRPARKGYILVGFIAMLAVAFLALGWALKQNKTAKPKSEDNGQMTETPHGYESDSPLDVEKSTVAYDWMLLCDSYQTAEEAAACENITSRPFFILHDGCFYHLNLSRMSYHTSSRSSSTPVVDAVNIRPEKLPVLKLSDGDLLVSFSAETEYGLAPLKYIGACFPVEWVGGSPRDILLTAPYGQNPDFRINKGVAEIDGMRIEPYDGGLYDSGGEQRTDDANTAFCTVLDSLGLSYITIDHEVENGRIYYYQSQVILGEYDDTLTLGQYDGTRYLEDTYTIISALYEIVVNDLQPLSIETTHDGYFVIDIDKDKSGLFALQRDASDLFQEMAECYAFVIS